MISVLNTYDDDTGELELADGQPRRWRESELNRLTLENAVLTSLIESLSGVTSILRDPPPDAEILMILSDLLADALMAVNTDDGSLLVVEQDTRELVFVIVHGQAREQLTWHRISGSAGVAGWVTEHGEATVVDSPDADPRFDREVDRLTNFRTDSILAIPVVRDEVVIAVIEAVNRRGYSSFSEQDRAILSLVGVSVSQLLAVIMDRACEQTSKKKKRGPVLRTPAAVRKTGIKKSAGSTPDRKIETKKKPIGKKAAAKTAVKNNPKSPSSKAPEAGDVTDDKPLPDTSAGGCGPAAGETTKIAGSSV